MAVPFLIVDDLQVFSPDIDPVKAQGMIDDATAMAVLAAPCINDAGFTNTDAVRAILRRAILRWNDAGSGALSAQTAGPFGQTIDTRQPQRGMFWPSEIQQLQSLCVSGSSYTLSLAGPDPVAVVSDTA
jgi:hypothetical protein